MSSGPAINDLAKTKAHIESLIQKYSYYPSTAVNGPHSSPRRSTSAPENNVVLLTGTTGNLGSDLLFILLNDDNIRRVYALNRVSNEGTSLERVKAQFEMKGLDTHVLESDKVVFIDGNLTLPDLGLGPEVFAQLREDVTAVVHNAWPINLVQPLSYYEPSLLGLYNLISFGRASSNSDSLRFFFISSISVASNWQRTKGGELVPEAVLKDPSSCLGQGYSESKFVAESILANSGLNATSLRFNQLCGRRADGFWNPMEWPPILLKASVKLGIIINIAGRCAFLQSDVAAECIRDVVVSTDVIPPVLNFAHPRPALWTDITGSIGQVMPEAVEHPTMSAWDFIDELAKRAASASRAEIKQNPALLLTSTFKRYASDNKDLMSRGGLHSNEHFPLATLDITKALEICPSLRNAKDITAQSMRHYLDFWAQIGFLDGVVDQD